MTKEEKINAILNLACVAMSRDVTPARQERAVTLLEALIVEEEVMREHAPHLWTMAEDGEKTWLQFAHEACPNWRGL